MAKPFDASEIESVFRGVQEMKESTTYRALLNKGLNRELVFGRVETHAEGINRGLRFSIIIMLEHKFGVIPDDLLWKIRHGSNRGSFG